MPHKHPNEPMGIGRRRMERNESGEVAKLCLFNDLVDPGGSIILAPLTRNGQPQGGVT